MPARHGRWKEGNGGEVPLRIPPRTKDARAVFGKSLLVPTSISWPYCYD